MNFIMILNLMNVVYLRNTCNRDILTSYGLHGLPEPTLLPMEVCPGIHESCCSKRDELQIYQNWVHNKERKRIKEHYAESYEVFKDNLDTLNKVYKHA